MIKKYIILLSHDGANRITSDLAYSLYSELLRHADSSYVEMIHNQGFTPLSQHIRICDRNRIEWHVSLFGEEAAEIFSPVVDGREVYYMKDKGIALTVTERKSETVTYDELVARTGSGSGNRLRLSFLTPASFKSAGEYVLFPNVPLIIKSLASMWNSACEKYPFHDEDVLNMMFSGIRITGYRMSGVSFRMKGIFIPSFCGTLDLSERLPVPVSQIFHTLLSFSEYTGIGIKTALGMGGTRVEYIHSPAKHV